MKKRILFVDDERSVLDGLREKLDSMRREWEMEFVESGLDALEILSRGPYEMVVADMQMPAMDGCQLLTRVGELYPRSIRIILADHSDQEMILRSVRVAHQCLSKPCESETLKVTLARALALRDFLSDDALIRVVSRVTTLPSAPAIYYEVVQELSLADTSIQKVGEIIARDVSMTAKILQLANSPLFGLYQRVNNLDRAMVLVGLDTVMALVITIHIFSTYVDTGVPGFSIPELWDHSLKTALYARTIAQEEEQPRKTIDDAFMGGILHDVGRLILAANLPDMYSQAVALADRIGCTVTKAEEDIFGTTHAEVGAYLMGLWGLPDQIVESVAFHHSPNRCLARGFMPLTAVHAGNALAHVDHTGTIEDLKALLDPDYLMGLNLVDRLSQWMTACGKSIPGAECHA